MTFLFFHGRGEQNTEAFWRHDISFELMVDGPWPAIDDVFMPANEAFWLADKTMSTVNKVISTAQKVI
jgi:hypothetical protein